MKEAENKPTLEDCKKVILEINKDIPQSDEQLLNKAHWLYMLNRLNFWEDMPILLELIKYEIKKVK